MPRPSSLFALLSLLCLLSGCTPSGGGGAGAGAGTAGPTPRLNGELAVTGESTLDLVSAGKRTIIARAPSVNTYFEYPVFSPDGKEIAYVLAITPTAQGQDWGNDIYASNIDGTNAKLLFKHDKVGALVDSLSWTPDGAALVYAYQRALYDTQNHYTGSIFRVDRLALSAGTTTTLLNDAQYPSVSWDGKQIVYVDFPQNDFQAASLAIADIDGTHEQKLLTNQRGFQGFFAPHLSPSGQQVAFAAVGGPLELPGPATPGARRDLGHPAGEAWAAAAALLAPPAASADGSPYQVWVANLDGSSLHTLSNLREDLPFPLWQADGQAILFLGAGGLYTANSDGTNLKRIGGGIPHGEIAWYQPR
jgi:Tol biopolymer transport system component